ncbi:hypothetical protein Rhow_003883 [Rhodococcus wratislaviensis]|uniref:Uncharacterized protein n=1 Tax=Rhodococcus wratislaviensis TaxID=44752 RepID=A0A402C9E9_RHOWR|nr:hypothetical protein Rhow_003883 [Rhodococcus wratislaviensis]
MARERDEPEHREDDGQHREVPYEDAVRPAAHGESEGTREVTVGGRVGQHQRCHQSETDDGAERHLDGVLPRFGTHQPLRPGEVGRRERECHCGDEEHPDAVMRPAVDPPGRAHRQFGQQHPGAEPGQVPGQPVVVVDAAWRRHRHERPRQAHRDQREDRRNTQPRSRTPQPDQREGQQRKHQVEGHFHRQTPHLGQTVGEGEGHEHLHETEIRPPRAVTRVGGGQERQHHRHGDPVRRQDARRPRNPVPHDTRGGTQPPRRPGMAAPQQESRQREEDRHRQIESSPDTAEDRHVRRARLERDVRHEHPQRRETAHPLQCGNETARSSGRCGRGRDRGRGAHHQQCAWSGRCDGKLRPRHFAAERPVRLLSDGANAHSRLLVFCLTWCRCGLHAIRAAVLPVGESQSTELG